MLTRVETLAPWKINLVSYIANLLIQFGTKTKSPCYEGLLAQKMKSARALWFWHAEGPRVLLLWVSNFYGNKIRSWTT